MTLYDILSSFFIYGFLGWCTEVAFAAIRQRTFVNRGFLNGPICPIYGIGVTLVVTALQPYLKHPFYLYLASAVLVTVLELLTGILLEKLFHHKWWDYSDMPLNIGGYVCPLFSLIWGVGCVVIVKLIYPLTAKLISLFPLWMGQLVLLILCAALLADLYITVQAILKFNQRLALMDEIAGELHNISDQIGENIYQNMMEGLEAQDRLKEKIEEVKQNMDNLKQKMDNLKQHPEDLYAKYISLLKNPSPTSKRLMKAFPKMKPKIYGKQFHNLRAFMKRTKDKYHKPD